MIFKYFLTFHKLPFHFVDIFSFAVHKIFSLMYLMYSKLFLLLLLVLLVSHHKNHCQGQCWGALSLYFLLGVLQFGCLCSSLNAFWVNFCEWYKIGVQFHSSACSHLVFRTPFIYYSQLYFLYRHIIQLSFLLPSFLLAWRVASYYFF